MLSIKNLSKVYSGGKKAVDNISLDIEAGEFIAFIGTSGSGKTTALRMQYYVVIQRHSSY